MALCSPFTRVAKFNAPPPVRRLSLPPSPAAVQQSTVKASLRTVPLNKRTKVVVRAEESGSSAPDVDAIVKDLTEKWDRVENKSSIALYGVSAIAVLYVTSSIVGAVNSIPLLPKFLELVGFIYTSWFVYRYLLFKSSREELSKDVEELKAKITGQQESEI